MSVNLTFPYGFDASGGTAAADLSRHVRDMIEEMLLTFPGERVNRPDFGGGLAQLVFSPNSIELAAALQLILQAAMHREFSAVLDLQGLEIVALEETLRVDIRYVIKATREASAALVELAPGAT